MVSNKIKTKTNFWLFLLLTLSLLVFLFRYVYSSEIFFKSYQNSGYGFSFGYPSNWYLCETDFPNVDYVHVYLASTPLDCSNLSNTDNYALTVFSIKDLVKDNENDVQVWISKYTKMMDDEDKYAKDNNLLPTFWVFRPVFVKYVNNLMFLPNRTSMAEIQEHDITKYLAINKTNIYMLEYHSNSGIESLFTRMVLLTFKFK